ncbi:ATP-binding protein [Streptomyces sp. NPDC101221]|uniref:ATP-binding protein n=1 Tax=Streptomyces sp. NPDC101221 TaxID=3366132 RepID=UPI003811A771
MAADASLARLLTAHQLTEWGHPHGTGAHDTVVLVVAENSRRTGPCTAASPGGTSPFLSHDHGRRVIRVEVTDTHPAQPMRQTPVRTRTAVGACSSSTHSPGDWCVRDRLGPGKTVRAECGTAPRS